MLQLFKQMWLGWNRAVKGIFWLQNTVVMTVTFVVGVAPVAIGLKLIGKKMMDKGPPPPDAKSYWVERDPEPISMDKASRQF